MLNFSAAISPKVVSVFFSSGVYDFDVYDFDVYDSVVYDSVVCDFDVELAA